MSNPEKKFLPALKLFNKWLLKSTLPTESTSLESYIKIQIETPTLLCASLSKATEICKSNEIEDQSKAFACIEGIVNFSKLTMEKVLQKHMSQSINLPRYCCWYSKASFKNIRRALQDIFECNIISKLGDGLDCAFKEAFKEEDKKCAIVKVDIIPLLHLIP